MLTGGSLPRNRAAAAVAWHQKLRPVVVRRMGMHLPGRVARASSLSGPPLLTVSKGHESLGVAKSCRAEVEKVAWVKEAAGQLVAGNERRSRTTAHI